MSNGMVLKREKDEMQANVTQAMVFAAGIGQRLQPFTHFTPKPLLEVMGIALIEHTLNQLANVGVLRAVINLHHLGDQIKNRLGENYRGIDLVYLHETSLLGTAGTLLNAVAHFDLQHDLIAINSDVITSFDIKQLILSHIRNQALATLVLAKNDNPSIYTPIGMDNANRILEFAGVQVEGFINKQRHMFCGIQMISPQFFQVVKGRDFKCMGKDVYPFLLNMGESVFGVENDKDFYDCGTPQRLYDANMQFLKTQGISVHHHAQVHPEAKVMSPVLIADAAIIDSDVVVGPHVVVGRRAHVRAGAQVSNAVLLSGATIDNRESVSNAIIGPKCKVLF